MSASSDCFVLRIPLLPLDVLSGWAAAPPLAPLATPSELASSLVPHVSHLRESYRALLADPIVREAIFVASPDLHAALDAWLRDPDAPGARDVERALTRYLTRMASRPTPFGLFGTVAPGSIADTTALAVAPRTAIQRHTRLDVDYLSQVVEALISHPAIRPWLRYRPTDTACRIAGTWRYIETRMTDKVRTHHLVSVEDNEAVRVALARAASGATASEIAEAVRAIGVDDADGFATALIDSRILQPDLACQVTGEGPIRGVLRTLASIPGAEPFASALARAEEAVHAMDAGPVAAGSEAYRAVARTLEALPAKVELARLFQVDAARPSGGTLGPDALALLRRGARLLEEISPEGSGDEELTRVKRAWSERFESREMPLLEAIDADAGIGAELGSGARGSSALLDRLPFADTTTPTAPWTDREKHLLSMVVRAAACGAAEIELTDADLRVLRPKTPAERPAITGIHATLVAREGRLCLVTRNTIPQPVARMLGRFCHLSPELDAGVRAAIAAEESTEPDAVYAEIVHLPEGRAGNVILRPVLRTYEIPAMGESGAPPEQQIRLSDLTVQLVDDRFVLRSTRLGRRVIPRATTAHNFADFGIGAYRFLCLLQADGQRGAAYWSWGPLEASPFLPRVRVGDIVLSRASWRLSKAEMMALQKPGYLDRWIAVQALRKARGLPRWVVLGDYDNELVVDLENVLAVDSLVQLLKPREDATLLEWYPGPDGAPARGEEGAYASEIVVPVLDQPTAPTTTAGPAVARSRRTSTGRSFAPGSEWVFAKAYGGSATADTLLVDIVRPTSRALQEKGLIDRWFFIRYADPGEHVRWRLQVPKGASTGTVRRRVERALADAVDRQLAWRVAFDTYEREVERYGGPDAMLLAERWFHADSEAVVDILHELDARGGPDDRGLATLLSIDRLLADLGFDLGTRAEVMRDARERFGREFKVDAAFRRALGDRLRPVGRTLETLVTAGPEPGSVLGAVAAALARRSRRSRRTLASLERCVRDGRAARSVFELSFSYVHMTVNRLIRSEARMHELVLYDFLAQTYGRQLARARSGGHG